jgi:hypothetical protein
MRITGSCDTSHRAAVSRCERNASRFQDVINHIGDASSDVAWFSPLNRISDEPAAAFAKWAPNTDVLATAA